MEQVDPNACYPYLLCGCAHGKAGFASGVWNVAAGGAITLVATMILWVSSGVRRPKVVVT
jgi:hypothetical protein